MSNLMTITDLERIAGKTKHIVGHAIARHGPAPIGRIGGARVWSHEQLPQIYESIERTAAARVGAALAS